MRPLLRTIILGFIMLIMFQSDVRYTQAAWQMFGGNENPIENYAFDAVRACTDGIRIGLASIDPGSIRVQLYEDIEEESQSNRNTNYLDAHVPLPNHQSDPVKIDDRDFFYYGYFDLVYNKIVPPLDTPVKYLITPPIAGKSGEKKASIENCELDKLLLLNVEIPHLSTVVGETLTNFGSVERYIDTDNDQPIKYSTSLGTIEVVDATTWEWNYIPTVPVTNQLVTVTADDQRGGVKEITFTFTAVSPVTSTPTPTSTSVPSLTPVAPSATPVVQELIFNGGFEVDVDQDQVPDGWQAAGKIKQVCNSTDLTKIVAFSGNCALRVKGDVLPSKISQVIDTINLLDLSTLQLSAQVKSKAAEEGAKLKVKITYIDETVGTDKLELQLPAGTVEYTYFQSDSLTLRDMPKQVKVKLVSEGTTGKHFIDDVRLKYTP
jgi:hypothetical protein